MCIAADVKTLTGGSCRSLINESLASHCGISGVPHSVSVHLHENNPLRGINSTLLHVVLHHTTHLYIL